ncbi:MAG: sulfurtransferase TusA family protein [Promethearchaeota archaeon]
MSQKNKNPSSVIKLNVTGKVCPLPAAETRKALKKMDSGQILEIEGDFEPALENVIKMAEKNGAKVLEKEKKENYFRCVVKKL